MKELNDVQGVRSHYSMSGQLGVGDGGMEASPHLLEHSNDH